MSAFYDHTRHKLDIHDLDAHLDVLAFEGEEQLSQPFKYIIEFTCTEQDIAAAQVLGKFADFTLHNPPVKPAWGTPEPELPLRTVRGIITDFKRLSSSRDEARYEVILQHQLALLGKGKQYRIYQQQSVPEIVKSVLCSRHPFDPWECRFDLLREYPRREQVMQYNESDLAFISRLLAEVGIWYRIKRHETARYDILVLHDDQTQYVKPWIELPNRPPSGLHDNGEHSVWQLQTRHQVVEKNINVRAYNPRDARAWLEEDIDQTRGAKTTYGEAYHYGEAYTELGSRYHYDRELLCESGIFHARLNHERYLNDQTRLSGISTLASLMPGQVLEITEATLQAFEPGALVTKVRLSAARDRSLEVRFEGIPYAENICFRPPRLAKPHMAGTIPARVTSGDTHQTYADIDMEGRYRVNFLFDRDQWEKGRSSMWLRLARPYAGDTYGLHLPLICGTEVAVAFENGDPDRPYIAHALHDSEHPDHVTLARRDDSRNVLRTPANNKLRMEDKRGQEHVKLSTEYSGKSQLNLGHLVNAEKKKRGEGFELRSDGWGAIRGGKGVFISADEQAKAQGQVLDMADAVARLQDAGEQLQDLSTDAQASQADPADVQAQLNLLKQDLDQLKSAVLLLSAPKGIALTSGQHLQLAARKNLMLNAGNQADISVVKRLFIGVGEGLSLFVRKLGIKLIANQGPVKVQAQNDSLELLARQGLQIISTEDEIHITAKKKIVLNGGGSYISIDPNTIESGTLGDYLTKSASFEHKRGGASMSATHPDYPQRLSKQVLRFNLPPTPNSPGKGMAGMPYKLFADGALLKQGVLDGSGQLPIDHQVVTREYRMELGNGTSHRIPIPGDYRNPEQGHLANAGLHNHPANSNPTVSQPASHTEHRHQYAAVLQGLNDKEEKQP
jgi:type VI secretion system secreted protein VgrG